MIVSGCVEDIIFKNIANGYTVLNIDNDGVLLTCVGKALDINAGQEVEMEGQFVKNNKFGEQFAFNSIKIKQTKQLKI